MPDRWFVTYVWQDPGGRHMCVLFMAAVLIFIVSAWALSAAFGSCSDELFDLEQALLPVHKFQFSPQGRVEVYEEGVLVTRSGNCVSPMLCNIWSVSDRGGPDDRILSVKWLSGDGPAETDIRCGPVDRTSLDKLKAIIEHYGKG